MRPPLKFFVAGLVKAQPRTKARMMKSKSGKPFTLVYTPASADDWKGIVRFEARRAWEASGDQRLWQGPLCVNLTFYFPRPRGHFRKDGTLKPGAPKWHTSTPDRDNVDKSVLDALTNLGIWGNDKQVCDGRIRKLYTEQSGLFAEIQCAAGCEIEIKEAD